MKKSGMLAASLLASSTTAFGATAATSSTTFTVTIKPPHQEAKSNQETETNSSKEKFAPRFDGMRFIETLVTAHR